MDIKTLINSLENVPPLASALLSQWAHLISVDHQKQRILIEMHNTTLMRCAIPYKQALYYALSQRLGVNYRIEFFTLEPLRQLRELYGEP